MSNGLPRVIDIASVSIGDTITVCWKVHDIEYSKTGVVDRIAHENGMKVAYTASDNELFRSFITKPVVTILLLAFQRIENFESLFELPDEVKKRLE
jgi:hypothetical protein